MAEVVGLVASIATLVQTTRYAIKFIGEVKDSSRECSRLLVELSMTAGILDSLRAMLEGDSEKTWLSTARSLGEPQGPLTQFESLVGALVSKLKPSTGLRKAGKAITWPFRKEEVKDMLASIERQKTMFTLALELDQVELSNRLETKITGLSLQMKDMRDRETKEKAAEFESKVLNWISQLQPHKKHSDVSERRLKGTGDWMFEREEYQTWRNGSGKQGALWCPGIPGAGKTSLIIDRLRPAKGVRTGLAFFYCDYRDTDNHTTANIIASLIKQLAQCQESLSPSLQSLYSDSNRGLEVPRAEDLGGVLLDVCQSFDEVFIVIDALDECDAARYRPSLLKTLQRLREGSAKLFVTSRPFANDIKKSFSEGPQIQISAQGSDVRKYLQEKISNNEAAEDIMDRHLRLEILTTISEGANGMFLLPALQIQTILDETTRKGMRRALRKMPKSLDATFDETLKRLQRQSRSRSQLGLYTLMWISHARRPLRVEELQQALAIDPEDTSLDMENYASVKHVIECCLGLVTVDEESSSIRLVHYSVQEYLQEHKDEIFPEAERSIAEACLTYLSYKDFSKAKCNRLSLFDDMILHYPFLMYAAQSWGAHAVRAADRKALVGQIMSFVKLSFNLSIAEQAFQARYWYKDPSQPNRYGGDWERWYEETREFQTPLHIASRWGLHELAQSALQRGANVNAQNSRGETPLWLACRASLAHFVEMLLEAEADGNIFDTRYGDTPLMLAASSNDQEILQLLLKSKVDCNKGNSSAETALYMAAYNDNMEIVRMLLDAGALPNVHSYYSQSKTGGMVLLRAEKAGQVEIVLTEPDRDSGSSTDGFQRSALNTAIINGNDIMVQLLLSRGATMDEYDKELYKKMESRIRSGHDPGPPDDDEPTSGYQVAHDVPIGSEVTPSFTMAITEPTEPS